MRARCREGNCFRPAMAGKGRSRATSPSVRRGYWLSLFIQPRSLTDRVLPGWGFGSLSGSWPHITSHYSPHSSTRCQHTTPVFIASVSHPLDQQTSKSANGSAEARQLIAAHSLWCDCHIRSLYCHNLPDICVCVFVAGGEVGVCVSVRWLMMVL